MSKLKNSNQNKDNFWKSLKVFNNGPEVSKSKNKEFLEGVTDDFDVNQMTPVSRRKFLALVGASSAFAAVSCTEYRDKGDIMAFNDQKAGQMPGIANHYASTYTGNKQGWGILIKTREGRPVKIEGNPQHPINKGKLDAAAHASILNLYDPSRLDKPKKKNKGDLFLDRGRYEDVTWKEADKEIISELGFATIKKKEIAVLIPPITSPTQNKVYEEFVAKYPTAKFYTYEQFDDFNRQKAWKECYGEGTFPIIDWSKANTILTLEADILGNEGNTPETIRQFAARRDANNIDNFNRLYSVEGIYSLTGSNADYRFRLTPEDQLEFVMSILADIYNKGACKIALDQGLISKLSKYSIKSFADAKGLNIKAAELMVDDLITNRGKSIVYAGDSLPKDVHIIVNILNAALENEFIYRMDDSYVEYALNGNRDFAGLVKKMNANNVAVLLNFNTNPSYMLSSDYKFAQALDKVQFKVSAVEFENESSVGSDYILPIHHNFEAWGDSHVRSMVYGLQQPVIQPMYDSRQAEAILLTWIAADTEAYKENLYHEYLMTNWNETVYNLVSPAVDFKKFWYNALHIGFAYKKPETKVLTVINSASANNIIRLNNIRSISKQKYTVVLHNNYSIGDGTFANNGWLQELPHPITKVCWDNYAAVSPDTAKDLAVEMNDMIKVKTQAGEINLPVIVQPGMADKLVAVSLGYGRTKAGEIGNGIGFNANLLISSKPKFSKLIYSGAEVIKVEGQYDLVSTQEHHSLDDESVKDFHFKRDIIREITVEDYKKDPEHFKHHQHNIESITADIDYPDVKWAMAVDMNKCVGCVQCTSSCNVENNVPVVGKDQVGVGREMHWMRIDRYYTGTPNDPSLNHQPMLCQHCDNAPCENVCPVSATTHSPNGLNQMVYNRCVGTRYCANNCPYKVRRFNFFDFRDHVADSYYKQDSMELIHNPEVTIRSRGVMEKCTFCIQRIMEAKSNATAKGEKIKGTDVKTACQEACPADAIKFGDMNDPSSTISEARNHNLSYHVLELLNVKPNVTYIAKLRNIKSEEKH